MKSRIALCSSTRRIADQLKQITVGIAKIDADTFAAPTQPQKSEAVADPGFLGGSRRVRKITGRAGFGSLEYLLAMAEEECRQEVKRLDASAERSLARDQCLSSVGQETFVIRRPCAL